MSIQLYPLVHKFHGTDFATHAEVISFCGQRYVESRNFHSGGAPVGIPDASVEENRVEAIELCVVCEEISKHTYPVKCPTCQEVVE